MKCERAQDFCSDYCEGRLTGANLVALEAHLAECEECRAQVADLQRVWPALAASEPVEPPADFRAQVWRRIDAAEQAAPVRPAWNLRRLFARPTLAAAAAALVLIVLGSVVIPGNRSVGGIRLPFGIGRDSGVPLAIGAVRVAAQPDAKVLTLPVTTEGRSPVHVDALVEGTAGAQAAMTITADRYGNIVLRLPPNTQGPIAIHLTWERDGRHGSEVVRTTIRP